MEAQGSRFLTQSVMCPQCSLRDRENNFRDTRRGLAGHFGRDKTLAAAQEKFFWPKMGQDVKRLVDRCVTCHKAKSHGTNAGLYTPLPVPNSPWEDVSMDSILGEIFKLHGIPKTITSDRDMKFMSHFWRTLWRKLGTKLQFSITCHPQTDGQTEVVNRTLGNLLRSLIKKNIRECDLQLAHAEFAYNHSISQTTGQSPLEVVYGFKAP
ncbi:RNA-directed DNA polymerase [Tanacetum coccineum]